jgi:hypothetical protein
MAMTSDKLISALVAVAVAAIPATAATARVAISPEQVAGAISKAGTNVTAQQVTLLADVVATTSRPALTVDSMERWGDHRMKVRMSCADAGCLPFYVAVQWGEAEPASTAPGGRAATTGGPIQTVLLRAGSTATLMLEGNHVHIQIPVVCLESGSVGQTIRVTTKDHRQSFLAQVGDPTVLRGSIR